MNDDDYGYVAIIATILLLCGIGHYTDMIAEMSNNGYYYMDR